MLMKVFERYFSRNPVSRQLSFEADTAVIVIIPVFNDPDIFATLDSLCCCSVMNIKAGVLIVVNHSEVCQQEIKTRNIGLSDTLKRYVRDRQTDRLRFEVVEAFDLPAKYAGNPALSGHDCRGEGFEWETYGNRPVEAFGRHVR